MDITPQRPAIFVLSLLFVTAVFCFSSSGVEGVPLPEPPATDATSSGSHKNANSHATKNKHDSTVYHTTKKHISNEENTGDGRIKKSHAQKMSEGSTTQKPSKQKDHSNSALMFKEQRTAKTSLPTDSKALNLPLDSDYKSELVKRDLQINIFPSQSGSIDKPVEIEVKSYASPPNASAVIEVNPKTYNVDFHNSPDGKLWPEYQMNQYPQETNGPLNWYTDNYQQPVPPSLSYVPTEELLHSQNFLNIPSLGSQLLYQYPVKEAIYRNPINPLRPKLNHVQETPKPLNNNEGSSKQNSEREYMLPNYPVNLQLQNLAYNPNTLQQFPYVLPQHYMPQYFLPQSNEIQNILPLNTGTESNYNPGFTKYVTKSYYLQTHPKLEWVPL